MQLIYYLPPRFNDGNAREVEEIQKAVQPELDGVREYLERIFTESNLDLMTVWGIERWERVLGISPPVYMTLEDRRFAIKAMLNSQTPYTDYQVRRILNGLIGEEGYTLTRYLEAGDQILHLQLKIANKNLYEIIYETLDRIVSAELLFILAVDWNRWIDLLPYTWAQLSNITWHDAKEEELP